VLGEGLGRVPGGGRAPPPLLTFMTSISGLHLLQYGLCIFSTS